MMMNALPGMPGPSNVAGMNTAGGVQSVEARVRQLHMLKAALTQRAQAQNKPINRETFKSILADEVKAAAAKRQAAQAAQPLSTPTHPDAPEAAKPTVAANVGSYPYPGMGSKSIQVRRQALANDVRLMSHKYGLDPLLIDAVIRQESGYQPKVVSKAGAIGLMQLMPATARGLGVKNPYDALQNMEGGVKYLQQQLKRFGGNVALALAAYNAGPNAVAKYGGIPPYKETRHYVRSILKNYLTQKYQP